MTSEPRNSMAGVPDALPEELEPLSADGLIETFCGICNESGLSRCQILGAIDMAKHRMTLAWNASDLDEMYPCEGDDDDGADV